MPGARLVVVETEFGLGRLEAILDGPSMSLDPDQHLDRRAGGAPGGEEGEISIGDVAADQEAARPKAGPSLVVLTSIEIGQFQVRPVVEAFALRAAARRQAMPGGRIELLGDLGGGAGHKRLADPGVEL